MDNLEKKIEVVEEKSLAMEILQELKENGRRWQRAFFAVLILLGLTIVGFLWYQSLWDYSSTSTYEANGFYAIIDSSGNIIAQDVSQEELDAFKEWWTIHGDSQEDDNQK